jgi:anion-transporting  ArsA/GET3 family ATPase
MAFFGSTFRLFGLPWTVAGLVAPLIVHTVAAWNRSVRSRWQSKRYEAIWNSVNDRLERFEDVLSKLKKSRIADLQEMPRTIRAVADSVYAALRRADLVSSEVHETEKGLLHQPPVWQSASFDAQATELYRVADKNIAEYRQQYAAVMAGVQRAEAQAAVFMTTLDSLRMKMIGYRLVGRSPDLSSEEFLASMAEAKLQLQAIDHALEELDFRQFPQMIAVLPTEPPPSEAHLETKE